MKIGITGAAGFIGSYLSQRMLANRAGEVRVLLRRPVDHSTFDAAEVVCGDLCSPRECEEFAAGLDVIYHLAHTNSPVNSDRDQVADAMANQIPLLNLIAAVQRLGTKPHLVYFSSGGAVYAPKHDRVRYRETDVCAPLSSYGIQKLAAEHYLRLAAFRGQLTATVLRVGNAYGTLLPQHRMQGLIGVAINCVVHNRPVRVFGNPANVRDYIHLDELCDLAERVARPVEEFSIVNVGSGSGHSVSEVLGLIEDCYGSAIQVQADPGCGKWLQDWVVLDTTKAQRDFGWFPTVELRTGIRDMMAGWHREAEPMEVTT
jgi:UDP-glucose 4-epimerase